MKKKLLSYRPFARTLFWRGLVFGLLALTLTHHASGFQKRRHRLRSIRPAVSEKKISKNALPAEVLRSFEEQFPTATIKGQSKRTTEGIVSYKIESVDSSGVCNVLLKPDGTIVEVQQSTPPDRLPQFVQDSVKTKFPAARIISAESITRDAHEEYELVLGVGKKTFEVIVSPSGKVFKIR